uniref:Kazal-like domain-containing protein n=1 Tax=Gopherus agassizii TaxID=38772 RepID=A0A452GLA5_9SAUR
NIPLGALVRLTALYCLWADTVQSLFQVDCSNYPQAKKRGPFFCPKGYDPICGTDGVKYGNRCSAALHMARGKNGSAREVRCF